ncbi:TRADD-N-associated membrane domain-containing protein [Bacillus mycoides]|uniref:TRADD-N-associated membrane domain-containing protein n=1 Tax=Bacillus mycoides TaxID=1405 RepID=UPI003D64BD50
MAETIENEPADRKSVLENRRSELKNIMAKNKGKNKKYILMAIVCFVIAVILFLASPKLFKVDPLMGQISYIGFLVYSIIFGALAILRVPSEYVIEIQEIENELDLLSISHSSLEERSEKLFKHHHLELKRYYDENLKQSSWIFIVGIVCIGIGFAIIGLTLYFLIANLSNELENKIIVASVGAIGAILSNFIAVIYLKMHAETVKALTEFHNRFVNTHHFYFSNFLLSKNLSKI